MAGLMLFSGLRSAEVLGLSVTDVDIGRGWVRVIGKGDKERRVPLDPDVAGLVQAYLLAERPETEERKLFVVAKGPHRGQPLSAEGLRRVFRYHREKAGVAAGHPHALRHSFGTALAEAGVDLAVMQALMGHDHVDSAAAYIHLSPAHVRRVLRRGPGPSTPGRSLMSAATWPIPDDSRRPLRRLRRLASHARGGQPILLHRGEESAPTLPRPSGLCHPAARFSPGRSRSCAPDAHLPHAPWLPAPRLRLLARAQVDRSAQRGCVEPDRPRHCDLPQRGRTARVLTRAPERPWLRRPLSAC